MSAYFKNRMAVWVVLAFALAGLAVMADVVFQRRADRIWVGTGGTEMNLIECHDLAFAGDTSSTATTAVSGTYYIADGWKASSADHGKVTVAVSGGVLTATAATATTGTLSVMIFGAP
jgi:hypothetical protein